MRAPDPVAEVESQVLAATQVFLEDRMNEIATIEWATSLGDTHTPEREAIQHILTFQSENIEEPYLSARIAGSMLNRKENGLREPANIFREVVKPFFDHTWPKERTLRSESLADALAPIPMRTEGAFASAVETILPLMMPFSCWSLWEFDLYKKVDNDKELKELSTKQDALALLMLLDASIGHEEGAVRPNDLDRALVAIRVVDKKLLRDPRYQRLSALLR